MLGRQEKKFTAGERACLDIAMRFQRKAVISETFSLLDIYRRCVATVFARPNSALRLLLQLLLGLCVLPLLAFFQLITFVWRLLLLPVRCLRTICVCSDFQSPGEKNLNGIHNAFVFHFQLPVEIYSRCFDAWVVALYGPEKLSQYSLHAQLEGEKARLRLGCGENLVGDDEQYLHLFVNRARERISQQLGHYLAG